MGDCDDELDLFEDMKGLLFEEVSFAHGKPGGEFEYLWPPATTGNGIHLLRKSIILNLPSSNTSLFAHYVWNASIVLADYIAENKLPLEKDKPLLSRGCIELGAGTALPSIVLLSILPSLLPSPSPHPPSYSSLSSPSDISPVVVITDYDDNALMNTIYCNLINNLTPTALQYCKLIGHTWGTSPQPVQELLTRNSEQKYGIILMADTIWERLNHQGLIVSCHNLLADDGVIYLCFCNHSGGDQPDRFFEAAAAPPYGFTFELLFSIPLAPENDFNREFATNRDLLRRFVHIYRGTRGHA